MLNFLKHLFGKSAPKPQFSPEDYERDHKAKTEALERVLGPMHDMVWHAIIPYQVGGTVDMYCFPNSGVAGVAFATMELLEPDGSGPKPNRVGTYELVAFTRLPLPRESQEPSNASDPFMSMLGRICHNFTMIGRFSSMAVLNPGDTTEIPVKDEPGRRVVFDEYNPGRVGFTVNGRKHCLLLVQEVHESEVNYAREHGSDALLTLLKAKGYYPYSDLDRPAVV